MNIRVASSVAAFVVAVAASIPVGALAQVRVENAWVRSTVAPQKATGAFMKLTTSADATLVAAASPVASQVEIHESSMNGGVMQMRAVTRVELPANKSVELKPGGYHVMLMGLAKPIAAGDDVPIVLTIEDRQGKRSTVNVVAKARPLTEAAHSSRH